MPLSQSEIAKMCKPQEEQKLTQAEIDEQVKEFLAKGGKIEELDVRASAYDFTKPGEYGKRYAKADSYE